MFDLFEERRIPQYATAEKIIEGDKGKREYNKALQKYQEEEPVAERMREPLQRARAVRRGQPSVAKIQNARRERLMSNRKTYSIK